MPRISPTIEGFRAAFRRPAFTFAEIAWRWTIGATACLLFLYGMFEFLNTLPVSNSDVLFLRTRHPVLVGQAMAHIFRGSLQRGAFALLLAVLLITALWTVAASLGREITVRALLQYFAERLQPKEASGAPTRPEIATTANINPGVKPVQTTTTDGPSSQFHALRSLLALNFLRAATALSAIFAIVSAMLAAELVSSPTNPKPGLVLLLFLPLAALVCCAWALLNWFLSLAQIFAVRDGSDAIASLSFAMDFCRDRIKPLLAVSTWCELAHVVAFMTATTVISFPLALANLVQVRLVIAGVLVLTAAYFAVADWLYVARLAGYVCVAEAPEEWLHSPSIPPLAPVRELQSTIDRDEPILSDVPGVPRPSEAGA